MKKVHAIVPMKMLGSYKAIKLASCFIHFNGVFTGSSYFMDCLGDKLVKTHLFKANECIPWIFHGNR